MTEYKEMTEFCLEEKPRFLNITKSEEKSSLVLVSSKYIDFDSTSLVRANWPDECSSTGPQNYVHATVSRNDITHFPHPEGIGCIFKRPLHLTPFEPP